MWDDSEHDSWSEEDDWPEPEESPTISCPKCGGEVYEEADLCPHCGDFLEPDDSSASPMAGKPLWFVILGLLGIAATLAALSGLL